MPRLALSLAWVFLAYPLAAAACRLLPAAGRSAALAVVGVLGLVGLTAIEAGDDVGRRDLPLYLGLVVAFVTGYVLLLGLHFLLLRRVAASPGRSPWLAFLFPIGLLLVFRYTPLASTPLSPFGRIGEDRTPAVFLLGLSYLAFRLSHLALEVRNGVVPCPRLADYLRYALFLPTMLVGPINPYSTFASGFPEDLRPPRAALILRLCVGATKFVFFASLLNQLSYSGLLLDGHRHPPVDLAIACVAYYLYLYCNFSGYCDMAVASAGLVGVRVEENFKNPFAARNPKDFWNRWHITLSLYTRDMIFTPLSKALTAKLGVRRVSHAVALSILVVFVVIGVWHGVGWGFLLFGLVHGAGVVANHYYTLGLKRVLGKERLRAYNQSRVVRAVAVAGTFLFVAGSLSLFANDLAELGEIFRAIE